MMESEPPVALRRGHAIGMDAAADTEVVHRTMRPKSASYEALRSAVYQLTRMADFKVEALLGSGFFADVYKVKHRTTGEQMVLKMNKSRKTSKTMLAEIQLLNRLSHPNILKFKGSCVHEGQLHALTEYINGGSLEELLMDESIHLSWSVRLQIAKDIVQGMVYLHSKNVFHRDLNPKNCLIQRERDGRIRTIVADFGLAAKIKQRRRRSYTEVVGSAYWMAPECLYGKSYCEQADVFSFGITLAEIIARIPADPDYMPRRKDFGLDMVALRKMCPNCPEPLLALVEQCCQIDQDERPGFEEVLDFLNEIKLSDEFLEESELGDGRLSAASSQKDLRTCVSEPILRLTDSMMIEDTDDNHSCDSEGDRPHVIVRPLRFDSMGSSNGSLYGSAADDNCGCGFDADKNGDQIPCNSIADSLAAKGTITSDDSPQLDGMELCSKNDNCKIQDNKLESSQRVQSGDVGKKNKIKKLRKSCSVEGGPCEEVTGIVPLMSKLEPGGRERNPSMQTLVANEGTIEEIDCGEGGNHRGGDSGIDPGEVDVFKFPPQQHSTPLSAAGHLDNAGDHTPIGCMSPEPSPGSGAGGFGHNLSAKHAVEDDSDYKNRTPSSTIISPSCSTPRTQPCTGSNERDRPVEARGSEPPAHPSPTHSDFSHSRTSSTDASQPDISILITPRGRSQSPMSQSWASSEFSITLPPPSTPWAPPSSPIQQHSRHSLPSSPQYHHSPFNTYRRSPMQPKYRNRPPYHRYSAQELALLPSCLQKASSSPRRPSSCRNSALFSGSKFDSFEETGSGNQSMVCDLQMDFERLLRLTTKTVHFVDGEFPGDDDYDSNTSSDAFSRQEGGAKERWMARQRSKSSPSRTARKTSAQFGEDTRNGISLREYGISLKTDLLDYDATCSSKYYKITPTSHTRLSSSTPDLSKLSLHSAS